MNKKPILITMVAMMLTASFATKAIAKDIAEPDIVQSTVLPVTGITETTDGYFNYKNFVVEAPDDGTYYTEFWLRPARYADNQFTTFMVYANELYVGTITPSLGKWQGARIDGTSTIDLKKGANVVSILTSAPEVPQVETLKVAVEDSDATFSSDAYDSYLDSAETGMEYDVPEFGFISGYEGDGTAAGQCTFEDIPLSYTFCTVMSFTKDQDIFVTSSSVANHKIDVAFCGTPIGPIGTLTTASDVSEYQPTGIGIIDPTIPTPYVKAQIAINPPTSEEMQGLNWMTPSQKALNSTKQVATVRIKIPKTGLYLIRVRHASSGSFSVADINVNGNYYYENEPITFSWVKCEIPADKNEYATIAIGRSFNDDPMLFIHGAKADRVVGYNDDGNVRKILQYSLSKLDSFISQKYRIKTTGISVNSFSSLNPQSTCDIIARVYVNSTETTRSEDAQDIDTKNVKERDTSHLSLTDESIIITMAAEGSLSITADDNIQRVYVYSLSGDRIGFVKGNTNAMSLPVSVLNISTPGIYIVVAETANGMGSKEISIK